MRKGFTLVEMLAVLSILAIIALLVVPIIGREMNASKEDLYKRQVQTIEEGARNWGTDHLGELPSVDGESISVTLKTLQDGGYIKKKLKNPKTRKEFASSLEVEILFKNNQYAYRVIDNSTTTITDAQMEQYKKKIDDVLRIASYDKNKKDALRTELDALPNEGKKYELLDYMDKQFDGLWFSDGYKVELLDHSVWYSVSSLCLSHGTLPSTLQFEGTCEELSKKYAILVNANILTKVESETNVMVYLQGANININTYLQETYIPYLVSSKKLLADSHQYMRLLNNVDVKQLETAQFTEAHIVNGNEILYDSTFPRWFYTDNDRAGRLHTIVDGSSSDMVSLPFAGGNSGFSIRTIFLTPKENILKTIS